MKPTTNPVALLRLIENAPCAMAVFDSEGCILGASEIWIRELGPVDVCGEAAIPELWGDAFKRVMNGEKAFSQSSRMGGHGGQVRFIEWRVLPWFSASGKVGGALIYVEDITEARSSEKVTQLHQEELERRVRDKTEELSQSNLFMDSVLENIPDMIFVKDAKDLTFVRVNRAGERLLGFSRAQLIGKSDYDFFPEAEAKFFVSKDRAVLESGSLIDIPEEPIHTRDHGRRFLHTKKIPIKDENGRPLYLLGISEDITLQKQAEEDSRQLLQARAARIEAEKAVRERDDFISIASHELKTPLTALKLQFEMFPRILGSLDFPKKPRFFELYERSLRQLDQFSRLVDELLDVSRVGAGTLVLEKQTVDLSDLVTEVLQKYQKELKDSGYVVTPKFESGLSGFWDRMRIEQVIVNLLTNAMKYGAGKPIQITTVRHGEAAVLVLEDHGIGISSEDSARIFERFGRAVPVREYRGLGLGLYITREIVRAHGGTIEMESEPGRGSRFTVTLPTLGYRGEHLQI